jgi:hypothetical protein
MALSLPVGAEGVFTPLDKNRVELLLAGWKRPMTLSLPVTEQEWDPSWQGIDRLLHYYYMHGQHVPGFRVSVSATESGIDPLRLLTPLVLHALSEQVHRFPASVQSGWMGRLSSTIACDAQAYALSDLSADHIFLVNREEDISFSAPDPLSHWQKIVIRIPVPFFVSAHSNPAPFQQWADMIQREDLSAYTQLLRQLGFRSSHAAVQRLLARLSSHEAQIISLPFTDEVHHYVLSYIPGQALEPYLDFCEAACRELFGHGYTLHVVEEKLGFC